ncbi:MAG: aminotransferase class V-fold PLP-dependent enzyme, partial [Chitinophagales bacterium]
YTWMRLAEEKSLRIKTISIPENTTKRGEIWNKTLLNSIDANTCLVAIPHVHWADGTKFDLVAVRKKSNTVGALLVIDGTQSVGALPFDVQQIQPDALICGAYKWLLGSYSSGVAYFGKYFDKGTPIEENWLNRYESENFANLVNYQSKYQALAARYDMGERSNFIAVPMLQAALNQLNVWGVENIQRYCKEIAQQALLVLQDMGCQIEKEAYRSHHLFGVRLPKSIQIKRLKQILAEQQVYVSVRGNAIRVSPHVYNTATDVAKLVACFKQAQQ